LELVQEGAVRSELVELGGGGLEGLGVAAPPQGVARRALLPAPPLAGVPPPLSLPRAVPPVLLPLPLLAPSLELTLPTPRTALVLAAAVAAAAAVVTPPLPLAAAAPR
jgi:hypothetical protein